MVTKQIDETLGKLFEIRAALLELKKNEADNEKSLQTNKMINDNLERILKGLNKRKKYEK